MILFRVLCFKTAGVCAYTSKTSPLLQVSGGKLTVRTREFYCSTVQALKMLMALNNSIYYTTHLLICSCHDLAELFFVKVWTMRVTNM